MSYFADDSAIRTIASESVLMLGGGRALLMQVAHPGVAAGVASSSSYRTNPWGRLTRTMTALYTIVFGTREEADAVGRATRRAHAGIPGAFDPELQLWVHATLVDNALVMHESYVRRLDEATRAAFYDDMKTVARVFGVPSVPPTYDDFREYFETVELRVTDDARAVARAIMHPLARPAAFLSVGLLSRELRDAYGIRWTRAHALALRAAARTIRTTLPVTPPLLRRTERVPMRLLAYASASTRSSLGA